MFLQLCDVKNLKRGIRRKPHAMLRVFETVLKQSPNTMSTSDAGFEAGQGTA